MMPKFYKNNDACVVVLSNEEAKEVWDSLHDTPFTDDAATWLTAALTEYAGPEMATTAAQLRGTVTAERTVHGESRMDELAARLQRFEERQQMVNGELDRNLRRLQTDHSRMVEGFERNVIALAVAQIHSMPSSFDGRCELGQAFTKAVEFVARDILENEKWHYDRSGARIGNEDND